LAYILLHFIWSYNYIRVWRAKNNDLMHDLMHFKDNRMSCLSVPNMSFYEIYACLFASTFILFIIFGIIYVSRKTTSKFINYVLMGNLFLCAYFTWHFAVACKFLDGIGNINFLILLLFAISIFKLSKIENASKPN
jgi:hypothetical protein